MEDEESPAFLLARFLDSFFSLSMGSLFSLLERLLFSPEEVNALSSDFVIALEASISSSNFNNVTERGHDNNNNQYVKKTGRARGVLSTTLGKHVKTRSRLLRVSTREFLVESFLAVHEPKIALLVAHSLGRTLWGESVIGSRICANINQRERGKTAR